MENKSFNYTYSASQQKEIEEIRKKYTDSPKVENSPESKLALIKKLDKSVGDKASVWAMTLGIFGALVMGFGMSLIMTDIAKLISVEHNMAVGILIGFLGMACVLCAYPLYRFVLKRQRKKLAPRILKLTDELEES